MLGLLRFLGEDACLEECVGRAASLEGGRKIDISRDDATIEQREHSILDVVLSDRRWVGKRVVPELLRQDALRLVGLAGLALANAQFLELQVADAALGTAIGKLVRLHDSVLLAQDVVSDLVFRIARQGLILLLSHEILQRLVDLRNFPHMWGLCTG